MVLIGSDVKLCSCRARSTVAHDLTFDGAPAFDRWYRAGGGEKDQKRQGDKETMAQGKKQAGFSGCGRHEMLLKAGEIGEGYYRFSMSLWFHSFYHRDAEKRRESAQTK